MSSRFSAGLAKIKAGDTATVPASAEPVTAAPRITSGATPRRESAAAAPVAPSRQGKKAIAAYYDPAVRKQLALLAVQEERTQADLLAEALNLLFEKYGRSPIAKA
jgi:hypothetical protein